MTTYSFIIGSCDDFSSLNDLFQYFRDGGENLNASRFDYELPEHTSHEVILMVGRGHAFSNDWGMDNAISMVCHSTNLDLVDASTLPLDELLTAFAEMNGRHNARGSHKCIYQNSEGKWKVEYGFEDMFGKICGGYCIEVPGTDSSDLTAKEVENVIRQIVGGE